MINFIGEHRGFACFLLNCDGQQFIKFRGALRIATGTCAGRRMGSSSMPWTCGLRAAWSHSVTIFSCPITNSTAGTRFGRASIINTAQSPSIPFLCTTLHYTTLHYTCLVNLGRYPTDQSGLCQKAAARSQHWCVRKTRPSPV